MKIMKGLGTSFQSSELNQKDVGNVCHDLHHLLVKFHSNTRKVKKKK